MFGEKMQAMVCQFFFNFSNAFTNTASRFASISFTRNKIKVRA
jgi:hypothetical protein